MATTWIEVAIIVLYLFLICYGSEKIENDNKDSEGGKVMPYLQKCSTFQIDRAHNFDIVAWGQKYGEFLCPLGHRTNRCKQATQQHKDYNKEEHHKHCLLDIILGFSGFGVAVANLSDNIHFAIL